MQNFSSVRCEMAEIYAVKTVSVVVLVGWGGDFRFITQSQPS